MGQEKSEKSGHRWDVWLSGWHWRERIANFTPSWFTVTMGTGVVVQLLAQFPYPAQWLRNLAYCFWILNIVLFSVFTVWFILRFVWYPFLFKAMLEDFSQSNYLGAIPIGFDTIITGLIIFYSGSPRGVWVAYGFFWVSVTMTLAVSTCAVFVMFVKQPQHKLEVVNGVWLISFIPMIVTSAAGSAILPFLEYPNNIATLVVCFFLWSAGVSICLMVEGVYLWRLMSCNLPPRDAIVSCCIPLGPLGQGSFAIQSMANFLANFIRTTPTSSFRPAYVVGSTITALPLLSADANNAVAEAINWLGIIFGMFLLGLCTFWLIEAVFSVIYRIPKKFNIGFWGLTFPLGTYCNGIILAGKDLQNNGLKGWGATWSVIVVLLWCLCASGTVYKGFWKGELFSAPGLEGWDFQHDDDSLIKREGYSDEKVWQSKVYEHPKLREFHPGNRVHNANGTYSIRRRDVEEGNGHRGQNGETERKDS